MLFLDDEKNLCMFHEQKDLIERIEGNSILHERLGWNPLYTPEIEPPEKGTKHADELVILIHGWLCNEKDMRPMSDYLKDKGYSVFRMELSMTFGSFNWMMKEVDKQLKSIDYGKAFSKVHFIGYSAGGLVIRVLLDKYSQEIQNADKVILLGAPLNGSRLLEAILNNLPLLSRVSWVVKDADEVLQKSRQSKFSNKLKVGLIAGVKPYSLEDVGEKEYKMRIGLLETPNDGTVARHSAWDWNGDVSLVDRASLKVNHRQLREHPKVLKIILNFLERSKF